MTESFYSIVTDKGAELINEALANGEKIDLSFIAVGDGNGQYYEPQSTQTELVHETYRANISEVTELTAKGLIPTDIGGFYIREVGVFDNHNILILIAKQPETYKPLEEQGSTKELWIKVTIKAIASDVIQIKVDKSLQYATVNWVLSLFDDYKNSTSMRTSMYDTNQNGLVDTCEIIDGGGFTSFEVAENIISDQMMNAIIYDQNMNGIIDTCDYVDGSGFIVEESEDTEEQPAYFLNSKDYDKNQNLRVDDAENRDAGEF